MVNINVYINDVISIYSYNELYKLVDQINFPYAIIKGEALSIQAYNKELQRTSCDIDILVHRKNVKKLCCLLLDSGFTTKSIDRANEIFLFSSSHQLPAFEKIIYGVGNISIDINFDVFWGEYTGKRIDIDEFLNDVQPIKIFNHTFSTLPANKAFVQLCLHHYKEMNSLYHLTRHDCIRESMFSDIYNLIKNNLSKLSLKEVYAMVEKYQISAYVYYILYYTYYLFKDPILKEYVDVFDSPKGRALLDIYGLSENEKKVWKISFEERLSLNNLFEVIQNDLTSDDMKKINYNQQFFQKIDL